MESVAPFLHKASRQKKAREKRAKHHGEWQSTSNRCTDKYKFDGPLLDAPRKGHYETLSGNAGPARRPLDRFDESANTTAVVIFPILS